MINFVYAKKFCKDNISLIENYDKAIADKEQTWHCHHRRELTTPRKELIEIREYYNRPASELIFLTKAKHKALHNTLLFKGKTSHWKGKFRSEETKKKMSESHKNMSEETKRKMSAARQGRCWYNNGIKSVWTEECPTGFVKGRIKRNKYEEK